MNNLKILAVSLLMGACFALFSPADEAKAWISGGIVLSAPVYPAYPAYPYPPAYPPAYAYPVAPVYPPPGPGYPAPQAPMAAPNYSSNSQSECREYSRSVVISGQTQQAYGHACRQPDGKWQIVD